MPVTTRSSSANIVEAAKNLVRLKHSAAAKPATRTTTSSGRPKRACATYVSGMYAEEH